MKRVVFEKICAEGVELSKNGKVRSDSDYHIVNNENADDNFKDFSINDDLWINSVFSALSGKVPSLAFEHWRKHGLLSHFLPEMDSFWGRGQPEQYHPEIDVGIHSMMVIDRAAFHDLSLSSRLACLFHDFGKSLSERDSISYILHEKNGIPLVKKYLEEWNVDKKVSDVVLCVVEYHGEVHNFEKRQPQSALKLLSEMSLTNGDLTYNANVLKAILCDDQGRKNMFNSEPRGVLLIADVLSHLRKNDDLINEKTLEIVKSKEERGISYGANPYDDEKRRRVIESEKLKLVYSHIKQIFQKYGQSPSSNMNKDRVKRCFN